MPSEEEIYRAVIPTHASPPVPRVPGAVVDLQRWQAAQARAQQAAACWKPINRPWPHKVVQAATPRRSGETSCPVCVVAMVTIPGTGTHCPICGRKP